MKILVTGGAGFIASHIVDAYIKNGHQVTIIDNLSTGQKQNLNPEARFHQLDINDPKLHQLISKEKPEVINHHAAQINVRASVANPQQDATTNILGSINLLEAARQAGSVKKTIFASTGGAIYGDADILPTPEDYPAWPISPYGIAKLTAEHYLHYYHQIHHLPYISLRYGNVYGPRQNPHGEAGVVAIFYQRGKQGQDLTINGDGKQTRDFVYISDVVTANLKALETDQVGIFNIGTSTQTTVNQLTEQLVATLPQAPSVNHGPPKEGEQQTSCLDISKAKQKLSWQPQIDLAEGLKHTARFFLE